MFLSIQPYSINCILFDLEGIAYNPLSRQLTPEFCTLVQNCRDIGVKCYIATGASREEINQIDLLCGLYAFIPQEDVFSCIQRGFDTKADPLFFQTICTSKNLVSNATMLIDDGINGIRGARSVGVRTCYVGSSNIDSDFCVATLSDFFLLLSIPYILGNK